MNKHLLYIAFWYPPARASGVYRALAVTARFLANGWKVTVITANTEFLEDEIGSVDDSLSTMIPPGVEIRRVPFSLLMGYGLEIRALGWWVGNFPTAAIPLARRLRRWLPKKPATNGADVNEFADNYRAWIEPVVNEGVSVHDEAPVTHVLATGNPYSSFEAARLLARRIGTGYSIDYRDPWTIDVFTGNRSHADRATDKAEEVILENADLSFQVNEAIAAAYVSKYPDHAAKQRVVPNGYDAESIPPPASPKPGPTRFGILGTLNERWPLEKLYEAWGRVQSRLPDGSELLIAGHLGYFEKSKEGLSASLPDESSGIRYVGPVAKKDVAEFYAGLDVLILPVPGGELVTSGKVYEAMALGRVFVCIQAINGGARALTLNHPLAVHADPEIESIEEALSKAADIAKSVDTSTSVRQQREARRFERARSIERMVQEISATATAANVG